MIDVAKEFSPYPSGRVPEDGDKNGEAFRRKHLMPAIQLVLSGNVQDREVIVDIDGIRSFGSSFLEEAFGGLSREEGLDATKAIALLKIRRTKPYLKMYEDAIHKHLKEALLRISEGGVRTS